MEHDDFALDGAGVDGTTVLALIFWLNVSDLKVPLFGVWSHYHEARVVDHPSFLVGQRDRAVIKPGHLYTSTTSADVAEKEPIARRCLE